MSKHDVHDKSYMTIVTSMGISNGFDLTIVGKNQLRKLCFDIMCITWPKKFGKSRQEWNKVRILISIQEN
jgi:hypothetical protein